MAAIDQNQMWEIIDLVIRENVKENEAIKSCGCGDIHLTYAVISDNTLRQSGVVLCKNTCRRMSIPTLRGFVKEVIESMRSEAA